jgi:hypothetical protein
MLFQPFKIELEGDEGTYCAYYDDALDPPDTPTECPLCGDPTHIQNCPKYKEIMCMWLPYPQREPNESFEDYWERVDDISQCAFCKEVGHRKKECPILKSVLCLACGFRGHTPKLCNKIKEGPNGEKGRCMFKTCKGDRKWGHWLVTCPHRQEMYGDYIFPPGTDVNLVYK